MSAAAARIAPLQTIISNYSSGGANGLIDREDTIRRMGQALWRGRQWSHDEAFRRVLYHASGFSPADIRALDEQAYRVHRLRLATMGEKP